MIKIEKDEKFKFIDGYNNKYLISNYGKVFNLRTFKFLETNINSRGYPRVELYKGQENKLRLRKMEFLHLLVVRYFGDCKGFTFSNPEFDDIDILEVDHIDKNPMHCYQSNLQIVSKKENIRRKYIDNFERNELIKKAKADYINLREIF